MRGTRPGGSDGVGAPEAACGRFPTVDQEWLARADCRPGSRGIVHKFALDLQLWVDSKPAVNCSPIATSGRFMLMVEAVMIGSAEYEQ